MRLLQKVRDTHLFGVDRVLHDEDRVADLGGEDHEEEDMRDIELPDAAIDLRGREKRPVRRKRAAIDQRGGVARDEDEHLGGVVEGDRAQGEIGEHVLGNVVDEDEEQRQAAKEIEPQIACRFRRRLGHAVQRATRTSSLPRLAPLKRPMKARGVASMPSTMSSRYLILPLVSHSDIWARNSPQRAR